MVGRYEMFIAALVVAAIGVGFVAAGTRMLAPVGELFAAPRTGPLTEPACQDAGNLLGFHWNWNTWQEEMRLINTCTGKSQLIGIVNNLEFFTWGSVTIDQQKQVVYLAGKTFGDRTPKVFTIDVVTGNATAVPLEESDLQYLRLRSDSTLIGLNWNHSITEEELLSVNQLTGKSSRIGLLDDLDYIWGIQHAVDSQRNLFYIIGGNDSSGHDNRHLYTIDMINASSQRVAPDNLFPTIHVRSNGSLVGLTWNWTAWREELRVIDPSTGLSEYVATIDDLEFLTPLVTAYDRSRERIYQRGRVFNSSSQVIFVIDARSGETYHFPEDRKYEIVLVR